MPAPKPAKRNGTQRIAPPAQSPQQLAARARRDAIILAEIAKGTPFFEIAKQLGQTKGTISKAWKRIRDAWHEERMDEVSNLVHRRRLQLDALITKWLETASDSPVSVRTLNILMEREAKLIGLDAPNKTDITSGGEKIQAATKDEIIARIRELTEQAASRVEG